MANRPVFIQKQDGKQLVEVKYIDFEWFAGLHYSQKQKSIRSLHDAFLKESPCAQILEVSSKSENTLGIDLSAFNLIYNPKKSINCQAYSLALYVSLVKRNLDVTKIISEKKSYLSLIESFEI
ncbi:DarT1-associated NADAR antitoxin family protein [Acinetobacter guillouiae]|uniref:Uncharacterized protein n=1 Tax=Acinetobacter guillouiae NIPH 991 TaxID=1217656 RepID=N8Y2V3_ACIGI|nr:hypothetical protein [Acinetobacter guillouiae]ENV15659.1 hypothetical protein F964_04385 [Acinetobacter guillouiae NIPH 991]